MPDQVLKNNYLFVDANILISFKGRLFKIVQQICKRDLIPFITDSIVTELDRLKISINELFLFDILPDQESYFDHSAIKNPIIQNILTLDKVLINSLRSYFKKVYTINRKGKIFYHE